MAWSVLQSKGADAGSGTNTTLTFDSACTSGSYLVAVERIASNPQNPIVSDPTNGTWTKHLDLNANGDTLGIHGVANTGTTALVVSLDNDSAGTRRWVILEVKNVGTASLDVASTGATGTSATATSDAITPSVDDAILVVGAMVSGTQSFTGSDITEILEVASKMSTGYKVVATPASSTGSFTLGGSDVWGAGAIFIKNTGTDPEGPKSAGRPLILQMF